MESQNSLQQTQILEPEISTGEAMVLMGIGQLFPDGTDVSKLERKQMLRLPQSQWPQELLDKVPQEVKEILAERN